MEPWQHYYQSQRLKLSYWTWGEANKPKAINFLRLLDGELATRQYVAGDDYSIADITGLIAIDFMKPARIEVPAELDNVVRWHAALKARPSATA